MVQNLQRKIKKYIIAGFLLSLLFSIQVVHSSNPNEITENMVTSFPDKNGIRVVLNDLELYFNASNGGEITEYFDLTTDPSRSRNLVNIEWEPYNELLPLFTSIFFKNPLGSPSATSSSFSQFEEISGMFTTGGDSDAKVWLIADTSEYAIIQSSSRLITNSGRIVRDIHGNEVYVNSTWIIRDKLVSVERIFYVPTQIFIPAGWKWYPFYLTRRAGFDSEATVYMFNTTYAYSPVFQIGYFPQFPEDTRNVFGFALPFSNTAIGGDGTQNILVAHKYDELVDVDEWLSDNFHNSMKDITESGAVTHIFTQDIRFPNHRYHMIVNFTHEPVSESSAPLFADYFAENPLIASLMQCSVTSNKNVFKPGDYYQFSASVTPFYDLTGVTAKFIAKKNSENRIIYEKDMGPVDVAAGQTYNEVLLDGIVGAGAPQESYTLTLRLFSSAGILIGSGRTTIAVNP